MSPPPAADTGAPADYVVGLTGVPAGWRYTCTYMDVKAFVRRPPGGPDQDGHPRARQSRARLLKQKESGDNSKNNKENLRLANFSMQQQQLNMQSAEGGVVVARDPRQLHGHQLMVGRVRPLQSSPS